LGAIAFSEGATLNHTRLSRDIDPVLYMVRIKNGVNFDSDYITTVRKDQENEDEKIHAVFFLISSDSDATQHLRLLGHMAEMIDQENFLERWKKAPGEGELREILLRDERFINLRITKDTDIGNFIDKSISEVRLPGNSLITIIKRQGDIVIPHGNTKIREDDELSIIGDVNDINELREYRNK